VKRELIGQILKEKGYITDQSLNFALIEQRATREKIGEVLVRLGLTSDLEVAIALSKQSGYPFIDLSLIQPEPQVLELVPYNFAINNSICAFAFEENKIKVAISDPFSRFLPDLMSVIYRMTQKEVEFYITGAKTLKRVMYVDTNAPKKYKTILIYDILINFIFLKIFLLKFYPSIISNYRGNFCYNVIGIINRIF